MPTFRSKSRFVGLEQKIIMTPADNAQSMVDALRLVYDSPLEDRWDILYESPSGTLDITQGDPDISWSGGAFDDYLGDVWVAFGGSGFTPTKWYKIEAVHSATSARLEHYVTETTASGRHFKLARPIRYTFEFEPGNYDFENYPSYIPSNAACISMVGQSLDAQIFFESSAALQGIIYCSASSGEINVRRLSIAGTRSPSTTFNAHQPFRLSGGAGSVMNFLMERCRVHTPHTDCAIGNVGTMIFRNNIGVVGYDGIGIGNAPDKVFAHGNILRSPVTHVDTGHGKSLIAAIANAKASTFGPREIWFHGNHLECEDDGSGSGPTIGVSIKQSSEYVQSNDYSYVSSHNRIKIISEHSGTESHVTNFAAGIYSWVDTTSGVGVSDPDLHSHGDVITLSGGSAQKYGYKAHRSHISIWNRPDTFTPQKTSNGTVDDDGTPI